MLLVAHRCQHRLPIALNPAVALPRAIVLRQGAVLLRAVGPPRAAALLEAVLPQGAVLLRAVARLPAAVLFRAVQHPILVLPTVLLMA